MVSITCDPAPDARERLRRIFMILFRHGIRDGFLPTRADSPPDRDGEAER